VEGKQINNRIHCQREEKLDCRPTQFKRRRTVKGVIERRMGEMKTRGRVSLLLQFK